MCATFQNQSRTFGKSNAINVSGSIMDGYKFLVLEFSGKLINYFLIIPQS